MRPLKVAAIALGALIALVVLVAMALLLFFDPNRYRGEIERVARQKTGRDLQIEGPLRLKLLPFVALSIADVKLGNPAGYGPGPFLTVHEASVGLRLWPLLAHRLEVSRIAVDGLAVELVSRGPTANNWKDLAGEGKSESPRPANRQSTQTRIGEIDIRNCALTFRDEAAHSTTVLRNISLAAQGLGGAAPASFRLALDYSSGKQPPWHLAMNGRLSLPDTGRPIELSALDLRLNEARVTGNVAILDPATLAVRFDLGSDDLDLDRLLGIARPGSGAPAPAATAPDAAPAHKAPTPLPVEALRKLSAQGTLRIGRLTAERVVMTGVRLPIDAHEGRVRLSPLEAGLYGGRINGELGIDARPAVAQVSVQMHVDAVDLAPLMQALFQSARLSGRAHAEVHLTGTGNTDAAILRTLDGPLALNVAHGALEGIDLAHELALAQALLKRSVPPARTGTGRTPFTALSANGKVQAGVLHDDELRIATELMQVSGQGTLDLTTEALAYRLSAHVGAAGAGSGSGVLGVLQNSDVPIEITGTLARPVVRPDLQGLARGQLQGRLKDKAGELQQKLGEKLKGLLGR